MWSDVESWCRCCGSLSGAVVVGELEVVMAELFKVN